jgi:hypothetical protein
MQRKDIRGVQQNDGSIMLTPMDIKIINDTSKMLFLKLFGNIDTEDIADGAIVASKIKANELEVGKNVLMGKDAILSWQQLKDVPTVLKADDIQATIVTKDFIGTLGLLVGKEIQMGTDAKITWNNVTSKPTNLATTDQIPDVSGFVDEQTVTEITKNTITTSVIRCDQLTTPADKDPIIKLFGSTSQAAIDATANMNSGWGSAIRLKWDNSNYLMVSSGSINAYLNGSSVFTISGTSVYYRGVDMMKPVPVFA